MALHLLFGNKSIERILFFLLINGRCYAGKLARHFRQPLTPLQQGLAKLEEMGVLESLHEGKIRYYQFNSQWPLLQELEALLRKAYVLLPSQEKKEYYDPVVKPYNFVRKGSAKQPMYLVQSIWSKLAEIHHLSFTSLSQGQGLTGWNGMGKGNVEVKKIGDHQLIFNENGIWTSSEGKEITFKNIFRWSLDRFQNMITLEHLRFGESHPVFLFHLSQIDEMTLESVSSLICHEDTYLGQVRCDDQFIKFNWRILGPKKNEEIDYLYT